MSNPPKSKRQPLPHYLPDTDQQRAVYDPLMDPRVPPSYKRRLLQYLMAHQDDPFLGVCETS